MNKSYVGPDKIWCDRNKGNDTMSLKLLVVLVLIHEFLVCYVNARAIIFEPPLTARTLLDVIKTL